MEEVLGLMELEEVSTRQDSLSLLEFNILVLLLFFTFFYDNTHVSFIC